MEKGRIVFLNGVTSAGKTSIVEAIQDRDDVFFYVVANDLFQEMIGERYLRENYWKYLSEVILLMYHTAKLYSDMGKHVLIDGILVERAEIAPHYQQLLEILRENPLDVIDVHLVWLIESEKRINNRRTENNGAAVFVGFIPVRMRRCRADSRCPSGRSDRRGCHAR